MIFIPTFLCNHANVTLGLISKGKTEWVFFFRVYETQFSNMYTILDRWFGGQHCPLTARNPMV